MRRVSWQLMPFLILAYLLCYIDCVNVDCAILQMTKAVGIEPKTYGLRAGIFFIWYFILEVPSNLGLEKSGARKRIARIMLPWGVVAAAETGFFPAIYRAKIVGLFMVAIPPAGLSGSAFSGAIVGMDGVLGLGGWQCIFITEAVPTLFLGVAAFVWLTDRPENAPWLPPERQQWPIARLATEERRAPKLAHQSVWKIMTNKYVLIMALVYAGAAGGFGTTPSRWPGWSWPWY